MEPISIRNLKLKYYVIIYHWDNKDNIYSVVSTNEIVALTYFISQSFLNGIFLSKEDILDLKELDILNPN